LTSHTSIPQRIHPRPSGLGVPEREAPIAFLSFSPILIAAFFCCKRMTTSYTPQEQATIAQAPLLTGFAVAASDLGIVSTAIEVAALSKEIVGAAKKYPHNKVIQAVFSEAALRSGVVKLETPDVKPDDVKAGVLVDRAIVAINTALDTLHGKATPEEISEYKAFIYACADVVAKAAGSGLFGSGVKVSDPEAGALAQLKAALAV
jgi:hypothetical protein